MDEQKWFDLFCDAYCIGSVVDSSRLSKPAPLPWLSHFVRSLGLDAAAGRRLSYKWVDETSRILADELSALQELILAGDDHTARFQVKKLAEMPERSGEPVKPVHEKDKSALHYAVLTGRPSMVEWLLGEGFLPNLNRPDLVTGFSPLQIALFTQNEEMMIFLLLRGARIDTTDNFGGTVLDYARHLGYLPHPDEVNSSSARVNIWNDQDTAIISTPIEDVEKMFKIRWCPRWRVTSDYIEELMFSGFSVGEKDEEFRSQYLSIIERSSGDENLILAKISDQVGWGAFAGKCLKQGDFIVRYGGCFERSKSIKDRSYCMQSGIDGIVLNAKSYRNGAAFINHSPNPNAESQCVFHKGIEYSVITAIRDIKRGEQILINYSKSFFKKGQDASAYLDMSVGSSFPARLPLEEGSF